MIVNVDPQYYGYDDFRWRGLEPGIFPYLPFDPIQGYPCTEWCRMARAHENTPVGVVRYLEGGRVYRVRG